MIITALPDTIDSLQFEAGPERSAGLHFSQIRESILEEITPKRRKRLTRSEQAQPATEQRGEGESERGYLFHNYVEGGFTFERALEQALVSRLDGSVIRPGEVIVDGIACSPDGISCVDCALEEYKFTWKSCAETPWPCVEHAIVAPDGRRYGAPHPACPRCIRDFGPKFWGWIIQLKAYCYVLEIKTARLRAFFVNGDYKAKTPEYRVWHFEFTEEELQQTWRLLVVHARSKGWL